MCGAYLSNYGIIMYNNMLRTIIIMQVPEDEFGHLLKGLKSGCPPHGGIALGV